MTVIESAPDSGELSKGAKVADTYSQYTPDFTPEELLAMHRWCLKYRDLVRSGGRPATHQDRKFTAFSAVTYATGVALGN